MNIPLFVSGSPGRACARLATSRWCTCRNGPQRRVVSTMKGGEEPKVTRDVVLKTARLAHLEFTDEQIDKLTPEFAKMVAFADKMNDIDISGVDPMARVEDTTNVTGSDEVKSFPDVYVQE